MGGAGRELAAPDKYGSLRSLKGKARKPSTWDPKKEEDKDEEHLRSRSLTFQSGGFMRMMNRRTDSSRSISESLRPRKASFTENSVQVSRSELNGKGQINNYMIEREIGKGSFGTVKEAVNQLDGKKYAIKIISKQRLRKTKMRLRNINSGPRARSPAVGRPQPEVDDLEEIKVEIAVLKKISKHPYFVNLIEFMSGENDDSVYMGEEVHCLFSCGTPLSFLVFLFIIIIFSFNDSV